jgi:hypothetical protein
MTYGGAVVGGIRLDSHGQPREAEGGALHILLTHTLARPLVICMPPTAASPLPPSVRKFEGGVTRLGRRVPLPRRASQLRSLARQGKFGGPPRGLGRGRRIGPCQGAKWTATSASCRQCLGRHWAVHRGAQSLRGDA